MEEGEALCSPWRLSWFEAGRSAGTTRPAIEFAQRAIVLAEIGTDNLIVSMASSVLGTARLIAEAVAKARNPRGMEDHIRIPKSRRPQSRTMMPLPL
jgi:hypothetical protein